MFLHGRTETIRSTSSDSLAFCKVFENSASSVAERDASLRKAVENHKSYTQLVTPILPFNDSSTTQANAERECYLFRGQLCSMLICFKAAFALFGKKSVTCHARRLLFCATFVKVSVA